MDCMEIIIVEVEENQTPSTSEHPDHLPLPSNYNESAVFYGPDGQIVSANRLLNVSS